VLTINQLLEKMAFNPSRILGIERGTLKIGAVADVVIIDAEKEFIVNPDNFASKGKNTPFIGWTLKGVSSVVISKGRIYDIAEWKANG
jgi:dihydroorotase